MSIDYESVGGRLADARRRRSAAIATIADAKKAKSDAEGEIEEALTEIETGEPSRPLLDAMERNSKPAGPTDYFGKRQKPKKEKAAKDAPTTMKRLKEIAAEPLGNAS